LAFAIQPLVRRTAVSIVALAVIQAGGASAVRAESAGKVRTRSFELLNEGVSAYKQGDYAVAVEKLKETASMALNSFRAHYFLGLALIGQRDYEAAIEALDIALDLDPKHLQSAVALGDAYLKLGDIGEARAAYVRAMKLRPEYAPALDGIARSYESQAKDDEAEERFRRAIGSDRGYAPAYTHLGDLYLRQGRVQEAVRLLEEAVTIRPDYAPGLNRLALAYGRLGMSGEAVATIHDAIDLEPGDPTHRTTLGLLQLDQSLVDGAETSFRRALELEPGMPEARLGLAEVARRRGDYVLALAEVDRALAGEHLDPLNERRLTDFKEVVAKEQDRVGQLRALVAAGRATSEELTALAEVLAGRGKWARAAELQGWATDTPDRLERLAYLLFRAGRFRDAHRLYEQMAADGATTPLLNTGVTLVRLGDDLAALAAFDRILAAEPTHRLARLYRGNALLRLGRMADAAEAYRVFLEQDHRGEAAERVRRIMKQIAPEMLPPEDDSPVPAEPPPPPEDEDEEGA
jgi:tetratricopeptide (TPR) repeat protein